MQQETWLSYTEGEAERGDTKFFVRKRCICCLADWVWQEPMLYLFANSKLKDQL